MQGASQRATADKGTLFLRPDNALDRILVVATFAFESQVHVREVQSTSWNCSWRIAEHAAHRYLFWRRQNGKRMRPALWKEMRL